MNKKLLIGSIIAICILVGVSFTSVVGYRSVDSDVKASPLFTIRSSRAIDEESGDLRCEYVGKKDDINLLIPERDDKIELMQKGIELLQGMDDETLNGFIILLIYEFQKNVELKDADINKIITTLNNLRNNPDRINVYYNNYNLNNTWKTLELTPTRCWFPGCLTLAMIFGLILLGFWILFLPISIILTILDKIFGIPTLTPPIYTLCECVGEYI